jgi:hypothetical protein
VGPTDPIVDLKKKKKKRKKEKKKKKKKEDVWKIYIYHVS